MKNLKIVAILFLIVAVSYFLFMVSGKRGADSTVPADLVVENVSIEQVEIVEAELPPEKSFATWVIGNRIYKSLGVQTVQYSAKSSNYPQDGESLLIFGDYDSGTMSLIFPGKRVEKFIGLLGREPYFEPMVHYSFAGEDGVYYSYTNSVDITGDPVEINITRWDDQFIEGTFSGLLTNLQSDGYHYDNKMTVSSGAFKIDLSAHPLKEI